MSEQPIGFRTWTYKFRLSLPDGRDGRILVSVGLKGIASCLLIDGIEQASDYTQMSLTPNETSARNHILETSLDDGAVVRVQLGYVTLVKMGIRAFVNGALIHESHPGKSLDVLQQQAQKFERDLSADPEAKEDLAKLGSQLGSQKEKFKRNWPSLAVDIALGFIFFFVAKWTDLTTAALWGAGAGLALVVVQQFVKSVDLLGGLALFGIVMMLISAGYALAFQDDYLIQMRTSIMGLFGAVLYLIDGLFGGRYLGERTARYLFMPDIVPRRLSLAFGGISIIMAVLNWGVVKLVSKDIWLYYNAFGDFIIVVILFSVAMKWVVQPGHDAAQAGA